MLFMDESNQLKWARLADTVLIPVVQLLFDLPSVCLGCYLGYMAEKITVPAKVSRVHREIPASVPCYANKKVTIMIGASLIAMCLAWEIFYLVDCLWNH